MKVSVYQDVEDPLNPLADDAVLDLAVLFSETGVRGSFCVTGEKCRTLLARNRQDVLDALSPHCLGLHTDTHSFHPTTMELLADVPFEEGCRLAYEAESRGFEAFVAAFGRPPAFWGGAGNTWSPEVTDALKRLGIPAYSYSLTELPDQALHRFNGVLALTQDLSISEEDWADDARAAAKSKAVLQSVRESEKPYLGIFVGHPTRFRYERFWDWGYALGRTPDEPAYAEPVDDAVYARAKGNLRSFLRSLREVAEVIGVDEAVAQPMNFRAATPEERAYFRSRTAENIRGAAKWPIHRPSLDVEEIVQKALALEATLEAVRI